MNVKKLSDEQLWQLVLTPKEYAMPKRVQRILDLVEIEFRNRQIKLVPIMK